MPIYTNEPQFGGSLETQLAAAMATASEAVVASGYTSADVVEQYRPVFKNIVQNGGHVAVIVGMAYFEGLSQRAYDGLIRLNQDIQFDSKSGVRVVWQPPPYHGKLYKIVTSGGPQYFAGSSNFSRTGLRDHIEFSSRLTGADVLAQTESFIQWLLTDQVSINIAQVIPFPIVERTAMEVAEAVHPTQPPPRGAPYVDISLSRVDRQTRSNLNAYLGRGRWSRSTNVVIPRSWFEVEIIVDADVRQNNIYPRGDFTALTDDGQTIYCRTQGDGYKNLRSRGDLTILGRWIKGKLVRSGALRPYEMVTSATLQAYGRDYIRLYYRQPTGDYFMEF